MTSKVRNKRKNFKINRKGGRFSKKHKQNGRSSALLEDLAGLPLYRSRWRYETYLVFVKQRSVMEEGVGEYPVDASTHGAQLGDGRLLYAHPRTDTRTFTQGVQRNAVRFVGGEYRRGLGISVTAPLKQLQWPSLADRRLIARLTLIYNAHTGKINIPLCNLLDRPDSTKNNYKYISTKNTAFGQSFFPKTVKDWNKLDNETKESPTNLAFKNSLWTSHRQLYRYPNNNHRLVIPNGH